MSRTIKCRRVVTVEDAIRWLKRPGPGAAARRKELRDGKLETRGKRVYLTVPMPIGRPARSRFECINGRVVSFVDE